ncbi:MAG: hypothetical protein L0K86_03260 [Actinomycetia bacterium]|nr:hypothetical protein [Actinomycetes bacterium]
MDKSLKFTRSSRKHRLGRARMLHVINHHEPTIEANDRGENEYTWYGTDDRECGSPLPVRKWRVTSS